LKEGKGIGLTSSAIFVFERSSKFSLNRPCCVISTQQLGERQLCSVLWMNDDIAVDYLSGVIAKAHFSANQRKFDYHQGLQPKRQFIETG
jgi:hypothetical protein